MSFRKGFRIELSCAHPVQRIKPGTVCSSTLIAVADFMQALAQHSSQFVDLGCRYTGVHYIKARKLGPRSDEDTWQASLYVSGRLRSLGKFASADQAARARDHVAIYVRASFCQAEPVKDAMQCSKTTQNVSII